MVEAESSAKVRFTANTEVDLSGLSTTLYILSGSEADSITVSGSILSADIPSGSSFSLGTSGHTVLSLTPSGGTASLTFNTGFLSSSGYLSQWTVSSNVSATEVSFTVGVPEVDADYLIKVDGSKLNYFKSSSAGQVSFTYSGGFSNRIFEIIREDRPSGPGLPPAALQPPTPPEEGFSVLINNGAEYTTEREVTLTLNGGPDAKRMSISESLDFSDASQEPYQTTRIWILSAREGPKTIYVKFYTEWGQSSPIVSDSIILRAEEGVEEEIKEEVEEEKPTEENIEVLRTKVIELKTQIAQTRTKILRVIYQRLL
ncbi:MAG: hypothetical protein ACTSPB_20265, partial [Candidatus Thorarchaeota archaeon]